MGYAVARYNATMVETHPFTFEIQADPLQEFAVPLDGL